MAHAARNALLDEFERALSEFALFVGRIPIEVLERTVPGKDPTVRDVLAHVVDAAYRHISYIATHCGGRQPPRRYQRADLQDLETVQLALQDARRFAREALASVEDATLRGPRFPGRGGGDYDGEQMLEHAIVHPYRHQRQLRRLLANEAN